MSADVNHYEPIKYVTAFDYRSRGPYVGKLHSFAIVEPSPTYPETRISIAHDNIGSVALTAEQAARAAARLEQMVADVDAVLDAVQPPVTVAAGTEGDCTCCGRAIVAGSPIQIFEDGYGDDGRVKHVVVHAERCPYSEHVIELMFLGGEKRPTPALVYGLWAMHRGDVSHHNGREAVDWRISHIPSGLAVKHVWMSRREAWRLLGELGARCSSSEFISITEGSDAARSVGVAIEAVLHG